jgi:hypothetical protein
MKTKEIIDTIFTICGGCLILYFAIFIAPKAIREGVSDSEDLTENAKYTIGTITDYGLGGKQSGFKYSYKVSGKVYEIMGGDFNSLSLRNGEKYLVVYSTKKPENSYCILDKPADNLTHEQVAEWEIDKDDLDFWKRLFGRHYEKLISLLLFVLGWYLLRKLFAFIKSLFTKKKD